MIPCRDADFFCVNRNIVVSSNYDAVLTPLFQENAATVLLGVGDSLPFSFVDWGAPREEVEDGVTFRIDPVNAPRDLFHVHVTCGLFTCVEGRELVRGSGH
jgi:hypothetical protein